jgi:hypothetical protein
VFGFCFILFGAYALAELQNLNKMHCQSAGKREKHLQVRRRRWGYQGSDGLGDFSIFYSGTAAEGDEVIKKIGFKSNGVQYARLVTARITGD